MIIIMKRILIVRILITSQIKFPSFIYIIMKMLSAKA